MPQILIEGPISLYEEKNFLGAKISFLPWKEYNCCKLYSNAILELDSKDKNMQQKTIDLAQAMLIRVAQHVFVNPNWIMNNKKNGNEANLNESDEVEIVERHSKLPINLRMHKGRLVQVIIHSAPEDADNVHILKLGGSGENVKNWLRKIHNCLLEEFARRNNPKINKFEMAIMITSVKSKLEELAIENEETNNGATPSSSSAAENHNDNDTGSNISSRMDRILGKVHFAAPILGAVSTIGYHIYKITADE